VCFLYVIKTPAVSPIKHNLMISLYCLMARRYKNTSWGDAKKQTPDIHKFASIFQLSQPNVLGCFSLGLEPGIRKVAASQLILPRITGGINGLITVDKQYQANKGCCRYQWLTVAQLSSHESLRSLYTPEIQHSVRKSSPLDNILRKPNPAHDLFLSVFLLPFHLRLHLIKDLSRFPF
jgi:hypothetical protein